MRTTTMARRTMTMARRTTTMAGMAMADPKQQQRPRLPEMEDLLDDVRVYLFHRPAGEPLLCCSVLGLGFANLWVRVSS
jgi:hypothetical protein